MILYRKAQQGRKIKQEEKAEILQVIGTMPVKGDPNYAKAEADRKEKINRIHRKYGPNGLILKPVNSERVKYIKGQDDMQMTQPTKSLPLGIRPAVPLTGTIGEKLALVSSTIDQGKAGYTQDIRNAKGTEDRDYARAKLNLYNEGSDQVRNHYNTKYKKDLRLYNKGKIR